MVSSSPSITWKQLELARMNDEAPHSLEPQVTSLRLISNPVPHFLRTVVYSFVFCPICLVLCKALFRPFHDMSHLRLEPLNDGSHTLADSHTSMQMRVVGQTLVWNVSALKFLGIL